MRSSAVAAARLGDDEESQEQHQQPEAEGCQAAVHHVPRHLDGCVRPAGGEVRTALAGGVPDHRVGVGCQRSAAIGGGDRHRGLVAGEVVRQGGGDQHLAREGGGLLGEGGLERVGVGGDHRSAAGVGHRLEGGQGGARLVQRDDVDATSASVMASVTSDSGVLLVSRPSESTRTSRWPSVPALSTASMTPSLRRVCWASSRSSMTDWAAARSCVRRQCRLDVGVEGHDADVDVVRDGVEERRGGRLGAVDAALLLHAVAGVEGDDRGTPHLLGRRRRPDSALESRTVSPMDTVTSSGSTSRPPARRPAPGWCCRRRARRGRSRGRRRRPGPPGRSTAAPRRATATRSGSRRIRCRPSRRASGRR